MSIVNRFATENYVENKIMSKSEEGHTHSYNDLTDKPFEDKTIYVDVLPETTLNCFDTISIEHLVVGNTYVVVYDGTEYECVCKGAEGQEMLGNAAWAGGEATNEPFFFDNTVSTVIFGDTGTHTIIIKEFDHIETIQIDEKYIPDIIARKSNIFAGKTASFYGDSLTEVNQHYTKGYHQWVSELLELESYSNYGVSGYATDLVYNKVNSIEDTSDIIFVMCGVNDQTFSIPLGNFGDNTTSTTYGSLELLCSLLKSKYPTKLIVFITPHYQTNYPHENGITSYEVSKAMKEVCEKHAIPVYDNFVYSGIHPSNLSYFTVDNCHWNDKTHEMVGKNLAKFMMNSFQYIYRE